MLDDLKQRAWGALQNATYNAVKGVGNTIFPQTGRTNIVTGQPNTRGIPADFLAKQFYRPPIISPLAAPKSLEMVKGIATRTPAPQSTPQPIPQPAPQPYRNPLWDTWSKANPKGFQELLSGTQQAATRYGVPQSLLMDISGLESGGRPVNQTNGPAQGYYQFEPETIQSLGLQDFNPYSATESALLAARLISQGQLSRWGISEGNWGVLNNSGNRNGRLTDFYTTEELNRFLSPKYQL